MKRSQVIAVLVIAGFVVFVFGSQLLSSTETYVNDTREMIVEKEVEVDSIEKRIANAQAEAMADIEAEANTMRDQFIQNELKTVEAEVLAEIESELKARRIDVEKETGAY